MNLSELICYTLPGWDPKVNPANPNREWMDNTQDKFAYRCLPLAIANAHGWEILSPCKFQAVWDGNLQKEGIKFNILPEDQHHTGGPVSIFGHGVLTFHVAGIFRTQPGWNLFVTGSPNYPKDGVLPLTAVIETDWSVFTFTINHKFTRTNNVVTYEKDEPICFLFPIPRGNLTTIEPEIKTMSEDPYLADQFKKWQTSRDAFQADVRINPKSRNESWQKHYFRGIDMDGKQPVTDHETKIRLKEFK